MSFDHYPITWLNSLPLIVIASLILDYWWGEASRWHPLVGFGNLANWLEKNSNLAFPRLSAQPVAGRIMGVLMLLSLLTPLIALSYCMTHLRELIAGIMNSNPASSSHMAGDWLIDWLINALLLYFAIGARSLKQHALPIYQALISKDLAAARTAVSMIVSRDAHALNETEIATATVESVLENGNDAIFGAIFWFVIFGGAGAVMFRLVNTLDAMWGYRTPRFIYFGWAAARLDDVLNLIPARLTALSYALCGSTRSALRCWYTQGSSWYSPNAGPVMAAGAGALNVQLGGAAPYHGHVKVRPQLGTAAVPQARHILLAVNLVERSIVLWCAVLLILWLIGHILAAYFPAILWEWVCLGRLYLGARCA